MKHQQKLQITYSNVGKYKHIKYSHFKKTVFCIRQNTVFVFFTYLFHRFTGLLRYRFTNTNATTSTTKHTPYKTTFPITDEPKPGNPSAPYPAYYPFCHRILPAALLRRSGTDQSCRLFLFSHNSAIHRFSNNSFPFYILAAFSTLLSPFHSKKVAYLQEKVAVYQKIVAVLHFQPLF